MGVQPLGLPGWGSAWVQSLPVFAKPSEKESPQTVATGRCPSTFPGTQQV